MRLKQLILHNFGIYAGTAKIDFENTKPVVLVGGMNGHGKTSSKSVLNQYSYIYYKIVILCLLFVCDSKIYK